jgi:asparagine synthase (glutamine-hydrolysing)
MFASAFELGAGTQSAAVEAFRPMCGIAGIFRYGSDRPIETTVLREMVSRLRHRGPDDEGTVVSGRSGLAHTRLSILDLSPLGHQPFSDETGRYTLVYNGEIYNYLELKTWLEGRGHRFRSRTDTEVVLRGYMELGPGCVERLIGMFAFALWDARAETLFLARDRIGEKPLVYADVDGSVTFASEIDALLADPGVPRSVDEVGLLAYLGTGKCVPFPRTAYERVKKLPPAHAMTVTRHGAVLRRYWGPDFSRKMDLGEEAAVEALDDVLGKTVSSMMMSDVPIGLLLSGGVDSSSIAFKMRSCTGNMLTFACGASPEDEEFLRARAVAERLGTRHAEHIFALRPETMLRVLDHFGEPISEPSVIYRMQMCDFLRRQGVTVILGGDGGDEVFGGYSSYSLLRRFPGIKRTLARLFGGRSPLRSLPGIEEHLLPRVDLHAKAVPAAIADEQARKKRRNLARLGCTHAAAAAAIEEVRATLMGWLEAARVTDLVDGALFGDLMVSLHHNHVMIPDAVGMSRSLEFRSPFLDARVVEFSASLPSTYKVSRDPLRNKTIVKRLLERHLPGDLVYAQKIGYGNNIRILERDPEYWSSVYDSVLESGALTRAGMAEQDALRRLGDTGSAASPAEQIARFSVVMLALWLDRSQGTGRFTQSLDDTFRARTQVH